MRGCVASVLLLAVLAVAAAGCGGGEEAQPLPETVEGTLPTQTETGGAETGENGETGAGGEGDAAAGEDVYASAGCGSCHTLSAAGSSGTIGPDLDESQPDHELVVDRVTNGAGAMPAFADQLSEQQIQDVAAFVVESTGG